MRFVIAIVLFLVAFVSVGYGIAQRELTDLMNRVRQPFNVNSVAQAAAIAALADTDYVVESARLNRAGLAQLVLGLEQAGVAILIRERFTAAFAALSPDRRAHV